MEDQYLTKASQIDKNDIIPIYLIVEYNTKTRDQTNDFKK